MSGATIGGVAGGLIGAYFGGPAGARLGYTIGSAIGGYVDPTIITGPRLTDASTQTAIDGVPITFGYGTFPTRGNVIWSSELREVKKRQRQGKGGSTKTETFTYLRSYAIGVCSAPVDTSGGITGLLQIKRNGKTVYDVRPDADLSALGYNAQDIAKLRAATTKFLQRATIYRGDEAQLPDPVIEAVEGTGNVAPFRGLAYMVVEEDDLTETQGAIPDYQFVVSACGSTRTSGSTERLKWFALPRSPDGPTDPNYRRIRVSPDAADWPANYIDTGAPNNARFINVSGYEILLTDPVSPSTVSWSGLLGLSFEHATLPVSMDSVSGRAIRAGGYWFISGGNTTHILRGSRTTYTQPVTTDAAIISDLVEVSGRLIGTTIFGDPNEVSLSDNYGDSWVRKSTGIPGVGLAPVIATNGTIAVIAITSGDQTRFRYTTSRGDTWSDSPTPFSIAAGVGGQEIHYASSLGRWVASNNLGEIAYSLTGISGWALVAHPMSVGVNVTGWDDGDGVLVGTCDDGTFIRSTDAINYTRVVPVEQPVNMNDVAYIDEQGEAIPDAFGWFIQLDGTIVGPSSEELDRCRPVLGDIVADLCYREGLSAADIDVTQLTDLVDGYRIANEGGADNMIAPLAQAYFFDPVEYDGKLRFIKRGGEPVMSLTVDDLAERDGDAIEQARIQEAELLRKQTVAAFLPESGYTRSTQAAERRAATIQAKGEALIELPLVCTADFLAQVADKRIKVAWAEPGKFKFSLPYKHSALVGTDIISLTDAKGVVSRVRMMDVQADSGVHYIEASQDLKEAYTSSLTGLTPQPPVIVAPEIRGPTSFHAMNLLRLRPIDDVSGMYVAATGRLSAWAGCQLQMSADGGVNFEPVLEMTERATIGFLTASITSAASAVSVALYGDATLSSATPAQITAGVNRFVMTSSGEDEVSQFTTATLSTPNRYNLTGVMRGLLESAASEHVANDPFVFLDSALYFLPIDASLSGRQIQFRPVSYGTDPDAAKIYTYTFNPKFVGPQVVEAYVNELGDPYVNELGSTYYRITN